jgi:hypothetical protein
VERAAALSHARQPRIHLVIATSEIHLKYKLKKTQQNTCWTRRPRRSNWLGGTFDDVEFSAEDGAHGARFPGEGVESGGGGRRADREHCGHGRVRDAEGVRRADWPDRESAGQ